MARSALIIACCLPLMAASPAPSQPVQPPADPPTLPKIAPVPVTDLTTVINAALYPQQMAPGALFQAIMHLNEAVRQAQVREKAAEPSSDKQGDKAKN